MPSEPPRFFTISQVTGYLKETLESDDLLQDLWLTGEVSNLVRSSAGHIYFTLKDASAQLRCVIWRSTAARAAYLPAHGEAILAHGYISIYEAGGSYQFYVDQVEPAGLGQLYVQFELLKRRLEEEGLFAAEHKRSLPPYPRVIGLVTSPTGAALRDILNVLGRRYPLAQVILAPTMVQGNEAPPLIVAALNALNARKDVEVIIVARGGGSLEELWAFNDERVARAIYDSRAPVISGVGHETDFTIADFVADVRAPTPSAAAELVAPDQNTLRERLAGYALALEQQIEERLIANRRALAETQQSLLHQDPRRRLAEFRQRLDERQQRLMTLSAHHITLLRERVRSNQARLTSLSPLRTLERGYAIVRREDSGAIVQRVGQVAPGDTLNVQVSDGTFGVTVERGQNAQEDA
jgi:exodeoxyribonuclease VII large subunit